MDKEKAELIDLCVEIFAYAYLDWEIDLAGNGTNASEAANVASAILGILGVNEKSLEKRIEKMAKELEDEYNSEEEDEDE